MIRSVGARWDRILQRLGWRFRKRYLRALGERHRWLKLIGFYNRAGLQPGRLHEVYVSLRLAATCVTISAEVR